MTAVVVTYHSMKTVGETMAALRRAHDEGLLDCVVVDNASIDETWDRLQEHASWAKLIRNDENEGFGRGNNVGLAEVGTEYVLFLNPDAVIEPDSVRVLVEFMDAHPGAGLAAPSIRESDGTWQVAGGLTTPGSILCQAAPLVAPPSRYPVRYGDQPWRTDWVCGAVLMARTKLASDLGGFDPRFFLYFEETDLCRRAVAAEAEIWTVGEAFAQHVGAGSAPQDRSDLFEGCIAEHYFRSRFYYLVKHHGRAAGVLTELGELLLLSIRGLGALCRGRRPQPLAARLRGPMFRMPMKVT